MSDDLLARATAALRASTSTDATPGDAAIARLERDLLATRDRRRDEHSGGLLERATSALRDATEHDDAGPDDLAVARLRNALRDGLLTRATHALRDETITSSIGRADTQSGGGSHRRQTLTTARRSDAAVLVARGARRRFVRFVALSFAAMFIVIVGWASASGRLVRWIAIATHGEHERSEHERGDGDRGAARERAQQGSLASAPSAASTLPPLPSAEPFVLPSAEPAVVAAPAITAPAPLPKPAAPDADALYRAAHEAHFARKDPAAALAAWDRYLAAAPRGRFALEARYNRAISLVRLGRRDEAAVALRPFASGDYGGYRKEEARELLQTLE